MTKTPEKTTALDWVAANEAKLSEWHGTIWDFHEPAWREYRSAAWYVETLRAAGFDVEEGSGGMPTAFCARWGDGGPVIGAYAEYDAVPGNSQDRVPYHRPREGVHEWAAGHTDPHSALGMGALGGVLAAKAAMEKHGLKGSIKFMGEPAEKVCGSKPVHAAKGYYDDMDAAVSYHPAGLPAVANTAHWTIHSGAYWSRIYTFECVEPELWSATGGAGNEEVTGSHTRARAPAANDALCLMYTTTKYTKEAMLPHTGSWTLNEAILGGGQATSDNLPPRFAQIQYSWRSPKLEMQERIAQVLDANAEHVARISHCRVRKQWVTKTRVGLPNHAFANLCWRNLELVGPVRYSAEAQQFGREIQENLGLEPMDAPIDPGMSELTHPEAGDAAIRQQLPSWQNHVGADDYVDYTWHTPTVRFFNGRAVLSRPQPGYQYPAWVYNALGGYPATIDPTVHHAARVIGAMIVELVTSPAELEKIRAEFDERTGGGIGGDKWVAPLLPRDFEPPVGFSWPEYVTTVRGTEWSVPRGA